MLNSTQGSLTLVNLHTETPGIYWNGEPVPGVTDIQVDWDDMGQRVKLHVNGSADALYMEMVAAGITVKKGK